jgi:antitoxin PrlF
MRIMQRRMRLILVRHGETIENGGYDEFLYLILPKSVREKAGIKPGEKLALITWESDGKICCISLVKPGDMAELAKNMLGPLMTQIK